MSLLLDKIDAAPIVNSDFDYQFLQWLWVLVDSLNESLNDIQFGVNSTNVISGTTQAGEVNSSYIVTNGALTTIVLPEKSPVGSRITIAGFGAGGWKLEVFPASGQEVQLAEVPDTATASISSSSRYDSIEIICVEEDLTWITLSTQTTGFVIV